MPALGVLEPVVDLEKRLQGREEDYERCVERAEVDRGGGEGQGRRSEAHGGKLACYADRASALRPFAAAAGNRPRPSRWKN